MPEARPPKRSALVIAAVASAALIVSLTSMAAAGDNAKWFICKYVGTPGVNESLQTGQNPISVSENAIPVSPVVPGEFFNDSQGRSFVLVEDTGQPEPDPSQCPPPDTGEPTPSPSVPASVPASVEGSVGGGTGTPAASLANTALGLPGSGSLATIFFGAILIASLGALAYANVAAVRSRR